MVRIQPNSAKARMGYGFALLQAGMKEEAAEQFEAGTAQPATLGHSAEQFH